ncbi:MAG: CoA transferase, partial [Candidatus Limnocylindrales bacterium]
AVIGPIYSIADIFQDPQYAARETITTVEDPILGTARVQNAIPRLVDTPGKVRHLGGALGQDNDAVLGRELGHSDEELTRWEAAGVIGRSQGANRTARERDADPDESTGGTP